MPTKRTFKQESHRLHRESLGASFQRRRGVRPLRGPTPQQTVAKPRRKPGSVSGSRRQTARTHFCCLVRTYRDRKNFGDPRTPHSGESARRSKVGKSYLVGSGGLWLSELSNFSGRHPIRRRRRSGARPAPLLHERRKRSHNTRRVQKTNTAPPKRGPPVDASTANRQNCVGMAGQKMPCSRQRFFEIQAPRNTRNRRTAQNIRTFDKKQRKSFCRASVRQHSRGVETRELAKRRKTAKKRGGSGKGSRNRNCQPAKVRRDEEKSRSKKQGDSCNSGWHSLWGDTKSCGIASKQNGMSLVFEAKKANSVLYCGMEKKQQLLFG